MVTVDKQEIYEPLDQIVNDINEMTTKFVGVIVGVCFVIIIVIVLIVVLTTNYIVKPINRVVKTAGKMFNNIGKPNIMEGIEISRDSDGLGEVRVMNQDFRDMINALQQEKNNQVNDMFTKNQYYGVKSAWNQHIDGPIYPEEAPPPYTESSDHFEAKQPDPDPNPNDGFDVRKPVAIHTMG